MWTVPKAVCQCVAHVAEVLALLPVNVSVGCLDAVSGLCEERINCIVAGYRSFETLTMKRRIVVSTPKKWYPLDDVCVDCVRGYRV